MKYLDVCNLVSSNSDKRHGVKLTWPYTKCCQIEVCDVPPSVFCTHDTVTKTCYQLEGYEPAPAWWLVRVPWPVLQGRLSLDRVTALPQHQTPGDGQCPSASRYFLLGSTVLLLTVNIITVSSFPYPLPMSEILPMPQPCLGRPSGPRSSLTSSWY